MSDEPLTNAAVEWVRGLFSFWNSLDAPPIFDPATLPPDFVFEDRRSTINFGQMDAPEFQKYVAASWGLGDEPPQRSITEVLAVRGQRSAAYLQLLDLGNGSVVESVYCIRLTPDLQLPERSVQFDIEDVDEAIAELDRMHGDIDDDPETPS